MTRIYTRTPPVERFLNRVEKTETCWLWTGGTKANGYGLFTLEAGRNYQAHRFAWLTWRGEIPEGLTIDHLCRVKNCVNPDHMELVTREENFRRYCEVRETCPNGHRYTEGSWRINFRGYRTCLTCQQATYARAAARKRERREAAA